jgi:hypothetical protein
VGKKGSVLNRMHEAYCPTKLSSGPTDYDFVIILVHLREELAAYRFSMRGVRG